MERVKEAILENQSAKVDTIEDLTKKLGQITNTVCLAEGRIAAQTVAEELK